MVAVDRLGDPPSPSPPPLLPSHQIYLLSTIALSSTLLLSPSIKIGIQDQGGEGDERKIKDPSSPKDIHPKTGGERGNPGNKGSLLPISPVPLPPEIMSLSLPSSSSSPLGHHNLPSAAAAAKSPFPPARRGQCLLISHFPSLDTERVDRNGRISRTKGLKGEKELLLLSKKGFTNFNVQSPFASGYK